MLKECLISAALGLLIGGFSAAGMHFRDIEPDRSNAALLGRIFTWASRLATIAAAIALVYLMPEFKKTQSGWAAVGASLLVPMLAVVITAYFIRSKKKKADRGESGEE